MSRNFGTNLRLEGCGLPGELVDIHTLFLLPKGEVRRRGKATLFSNSPGLKFG
jgi:hypothetical protein